MVERWVNAPINPLLWKLLVGNPSEVQMDDFVQEQTKVQPFADIRTLDDLRLLTSPAFEQLVGDVMQHMDYAQVQVVGRSRDLCVDITARGPRGEQAAVQCKRYAKRKVNSDEMQKFIGMIYLHHHADKGMYFTTSSYTKDARKLGEDNCIEIIDGHDLIKIIRDL
jgi:restriction endonuclease Mrr